MVLKHFLVLVITLIFLSDFVNGFKKKKDLKEVFSWKQIGFDFDSVEFINSTDSDKFDHRPYEDHEPFFDRYNNVPIGMEVYGDKVFVTVPRRRYGIPSTLNYVLRNTSSPLLRPYPDTTRGRELVSVYRPRVDDCDRLWVVDTGLLEIPGARKQVQKPAIIVYDLMTDKQILRYELKDSDLINERASGGLISIAVDVPGDNCDCAHAYIPELATGAIIVFSMARRDSWRVQHPSFIHDESSLNFTSAGQTINWKDNVFSVALSEPDECGSRTAYYHPLVSTKEFAINTAYLQEKGANVDGHIKVVGDRGALTQSGSHAYHEATRTLLFANVAQDAILCWNVDTELTPDNVAVIAQDHKKLVYISDLKIVGRYVWVLVNQIPRFVFSKLNENEFNYFIHRGKIQNLIKGTVCDRSKGKSS